jgi:hypothetical protein
MSTPGRDVGHSADDGEEIIRGGHGRILTCRMALAVPASMADTPVMARCGQTVTATEMTSRMSEHERVISRRTGRAGRPSKGPRTFVGLRLPDQLHEAVEEARAESGLTTNDFCIGLIQRAMEAGLIPSAQTPGQDRLPLSA